MITPNTLALQSLLFSAVQSLLLRDERRMLGRHHRRGRNGYALLGILGIMLLKLSYQRRLVVERINSELKDGHLPDVICKRGSRARYEISLSVLLYTMKKERNKLILYEQQKTHRAS